MDLRAGGPRVYYTMSVRDVHHYLTFILRLPTGEVRVSGTRGRSGWPFTSEGSFLYLYGTPKYYMLWVLIILLGCVIAFGFIDGAFKKDIFDKKDFYDSYRKNKRR